MLECSESNAEQLVSKHLKGQSIMNQTTPMSKVVSPIAAATIVTNTIEVLKIVPVTGNNKEKKN